MKLIKKLLVFILLPTCLVVTGKEKLSHEAISTEFTALQGISSVQFFFLPDATPEKIQSLNKLTLQSLQKMGKVIPKSLDIQNPTREMNNPNSSFKSPSLIYTFKKISDIQGNILPFSKATLELKTGACNSIS